MRYLHSKSHYAFGKIYLRQFSYKELSGLGVRVDKSLANRVKGTGFKSQYQLHLRMSYNGPLVG